MMQNGRINSPKLRPCLSSSEKPKLKNMPTCLERDVLIKTKYGHRSIMLIIITAKNFNLNFITQLLSYNFS
jgi:hypothetical protein